MKWPVSWNRPLSKDEREWLARLNDGDRESFRVGEVLRELPSEDECPFSVPVERRGEGDERTVEKAWFGIGLGCGESLPGRRQESDETVDV